MRQKKGDFRDIWEMMKTLIWAGIIAIVIRSLLVEPFNIPSGSMIPSLLVGDYLFVTKFSYGYSRFSFPFAAIPFSGRIGFGAPVRGDVVVFRPPGQPDTDYIKRVIGLPGDRIQMKSGVLYINDQPVMRERIADYVDPDNSAAPGVPQYIETLPNGVRHRVLESQGDEGPLDNTPIFEVPADHYFMMGDNRDNSSDSRAPGGFSYGTLDFDHTILRDNGLLSPVGFVPRENLIGPAQILFWSYGPEARWINPASWISAVRWRRLLLLVR
ncbi:MAG TPA: signal peptidase I [Dongiaceae bacterium]|jgi:signal peptidase I|nr:signal peptidase I [Dongiaceae bacterium]